MAIICLLGGICFAYLYWLISGVHNEAVEINKFTQAVNDTTKSLNNQLVATNQAAINESKLVDAIDRKIDSTNAHLSNLDDRVNESFANQENISEELLKLNNQVVNTNNTIKSLAQGIDIQNKEIDERFEKLFGSVLNGKEFPVTIADLIDAASKLDDRIEALKESLELISELISKKK